MYPQSVLGLGTDVYLVEAVTGHIKQISKRTARIQLLQRWGGIRENGWYKHMRRTRCTY